MNTFVEKNKKWLKFYSSASRILGWVIILFVCMVVFSLLKMSLEIREQQIFLTHLGTILEVTLGRLPVGIILLGIGQLLTYTYDEEYKKPWLLRNGSKTLYLFAVLVFLRPFIFYLYQYSMNYAPNLAFTSSSSSLADVLILIGLGNILKRALPIIEEHKSLV